ncbi:MAG: hypothetical protein LIO67_01975 [Lachnospiraceae bacterium]|nr:hypothetical protein [Lachnospiraceae bacterium]
MMLLSLAACGSSQEAEESAGVSSTEIENIEETTEETGENVKVDIESGEKLKQESDTGNSEEGEETVSEPETDDLMQEEAMKMNVQIGNSNFTATLESNEAVDALVEMMESGPVTISMSDYSGFEKVGALGTSLPTSDCQTTTQAGDIVLYNGDQIVIFYGSNSWSYTRLGKIDDLTGWEETLGTGNVEVTFSLD